MLPHGQDIYDFSRLGLTERIGDEFESLGIEGAELARVVRVDRGFPLVTSASGTYRTELATHLMKQAKHHARYRPAVGDWIALTHPAGHEMAIIERILDRTGAFTRKDPGEDAGAQVVIANVDIVFVVAALSGDGVNVGRLERALVLAFESGATPYIVLTKADLCDDINAQVKLAESVSAGVEVIVESAITGLGIDRIRELIKPGITAALIGSSGVGKSTLINRMLGEEVLATAEVREGDDKGRHTTVAREIVAIPDGGIVIDTPGMRAIALWHADEGLRRAYPEISEASDQCRFSDCTHTNEPKCAVQAGIEAGDIDAARFARYQMLVEELEELEYKQQKREWSASERRDRSLHQGKSISYHPAAARGRAKKKRR